MTVLLNRTDDNKDDRNFRDNTLKYNHLSEKLNDWYRGLYDNKLISSVYFENEMAQPITAVKISLRIFVAI